MEKSTGTHSLNNMVSRLSVPVLVLVTTAIVYLLSLEGYSAKLPYGKVCRQWSWENSSGAPADVLFVGTSRTFRAIQLPWMRNNLATGNSRYKTIDKMDVGGPEHIMAVGNSMAYLENRGVPKVVVIENIFTQRGRERQSQLRTDVYAQLSPTLSRYMAAGKYWSIQSQLDDQSGHTLADFLDVEYTGPIEFQAEKLKNVLYEFLGAPHMVMNQLSDVCKKYYDKVQSRDGRKSKIRYADSKPLTAREVKRNLRYLKSFVPLDPKADYRTYDVALMRLLISIFKQAGTEKIIVWLPNDYLLGYDQDVDRALTSLYDESDEIIYREIVEVLEPYDKRRIFRNSSHVNKYGARFVSDFWLREISSYD
jgi:hypothetical protein